MRDSVGSAAREFMSRFEGELPYMYLDIKGLVTTGIGDLVDPYSVAARLPWVHRLTGVSATSQEVFAAWTKVKGAVSMMRVGGGAYEGLTDLRLTYDGLVSLMMGRLRLDDAFLARRWPGYASWPADAQLACLSCAWAAGPAWHAPRLDAALALPDFDAAAGPPGDAATHPECRGEAWLNDTSNPGLRPRNLSNKLLFENAACVQSLSAMYDPDVLYWPERLSR